MAGEGLYQVHFVVPAVPSDLPICTDLKGNGRHRVTVGGKETVVDLTREQGARLVAAE